MIFNADDPAPSPSPTDVAQAAVQNALDLASLIFGGAVGLVIAFVVALVIVLLTRPIARRSRYFAAVTKRVRTSYYITAMAWGAWSGLQFMLVNTTLSDWSNGGMVGFPWSGHYRHFDDDLDGLQQRMDLRRCSTNPPGKRRRGFP